MRTRLILLVAVLLILLVAVLLGTATAARADT